MHAVQPATLVLRRSQCAGGEVVAAEQRARASAGTMMTATTMWLIDKTTLVAVLASLVALPAPNCCAIWIAGKRHAGPTSGRWSWPANPAQQALLEQRLGWD